MISDTLSDAVDAMRQYLTSFPEAYQRYQPELDRLVVSMDDMRRRIDVTQVDPDAQRCPRCGKYGADGHTLACDQGAE